MRYKLINEPNPNFSIIEQILYNRNIPKEEMYHFLHTTEEDINDPFLLGKKDVTNFITTLLRGIKANKKLIFNTDCDCDGYISAALMINYLYCLFPDFVSKRVEWWHHSGKQHGLGDYPIEELEDNSAIMICLDSSSNDYKEHKELQEKGIPVLIGDHHIAPHKSEDAITVNNQLSDYPNKALCGGGVAWQICRAMDKLLDVHYANQFIDLAIISVIGDMMSLTDFENRELIREGLNDENLRNPFFSALRQQNNFSIGPELTPFGVAFYLVPYVNATVRSGTQEEKDLIFRSMLTMCAFEKVPSTKRGHKGEEETLVEQAIRTVLAIKRRQKKAEDEGMALLEKLIKENDMLKEPVLVFTLEDTSIEPNIRGLAANKIMAKYQRPVLVLVKTENPDKEEVYAGSARGYGKSEIQDFRQLIEDSNLVNFATGHQNAFGVEVVRDRLPALKEYFEKCFKNVPNEPLYYVDYIIQDSLITSFSDNRKIQEIASYKKMWGQNIEEPLIALEEIHISADNIRILSREKSPTLQVKLPGFELIKFSLTEEEVELVDNLNGDLILTAIGTCDINEWNGKITPQIKLKEIEFSKASTWIF